MNIIYTGYDKQNMVYTVTYIFCLKLLVKVSDMRTNILSVVNAGSPINRSSRSMHKRPAETPPSQLKRKSVLDQLITSVEKLNVHKRPSVSERLERSVEKLKIAATSQHHRPLATTKTACKRLPFTLDHSYTPKDTEDVKQKIKDVMDDDLLSCITNPVIDSECLRGVNEELSRIIQGRKSILLKKTSDVLKECNLFSACVIEMYSSCPLLFKVLISSLGRYDTVEKKIATLATIYGMIIHSRDHLASAIQRLYSSLAIRYHADNKLMQRLNQVHITMSDSSKINLIKEFGADLEENLIKDLARGKNGKLNGDNLDIRVNTNDIRMSNRNKDYHFFASNFVIDRVKPDVSVEQVPVDLNASTLCVDKYVPNDSEISIYKDSLKVLLGRVMAEHISGFTWFSKVMPDHIHHIHQEEMAQPSKVHSLPLSLNNECSYEGCLHILQEYTDMINKWYRKSGRVNELDKLKVPVGGDQLTRVRFQGAKSLRAGCHTYQERFEQLHPMIIELFHTLQDFLEKMCKKFLKLNSGRDKGTLTHIKINIQRSNVNGNVKSRFKAHEDFVVCVGHAYFLTYIMNKFQMTSLSDEPLHSSLPDNLNNLHMKRKGEIFHMLMDEIVADIYIPFNSEEQKEINICVEVVGQILHILSKIHEEYVTIPMVMNNTLIHVKVPLTRVKEGCKVQIKGVELQIKTVTENQGQKDDLHNYVKNYLQWYFVIMQLQDAIHQGDITRTNVVLKTMTPFFYSHSVLSKYFTECIDYILKTEIMLPPILSLQVRAGSFVNIHGGMGKNKAADMHKENKVKLLKDLIRGLGANKTEKSIVAMSKAAPVISSIANNLDTMLTLKSITTKHKKRSSTEDIQAIIQILLQNSPWHVTPRNLSGFSGIDKSPFAFNLCLFKKTVQNTVQRLQRDIPEPIEDASEDDTQDDSSDSNDEI